MRFHALRTFLHSIPGSTTYWSWRLVHRISFGSLLALFFGVVQSIAQPIVISEFIASNQSGLTDEDGDWSDWMELYNAGNEPASITGWYLTDDATDLTKWTFPDTTLPGRSTLIVFASGKDRSEAGSELHTNFRLNRDGGYLGLIQADGRTVSHAYEPEYPPQFREISYGIRMQFETTAFVPIQARGKLLFPKNNALGMSWTLPDFNDTQWLDVTLGIGYQQEVSDGAPGSPTELNTPPGNASSRTDVTQPGDSIEPSSFLSPSSEGVINAIDNNKDTKYLNFDKLNAGFTVKMASGAAAVTGLRLTSANDAPDRDPSEFILSGSNNGAAFRQIATGSIPEFSNRFETVEINFENETAYAYYRLLFPNVRNATVAVAMQIAEVEFLSSNDGTPSITPGEIDLSKLQDISGPEDSINPTTFNSPTNEEVWRAIDNDSGTKYLNFDGPGSGFILQPAVGSTILNGLRFTSANDAPGRDPASYRLEGLSDDNTFELIAMGTMPPFEDRFTEVEVSFVNDKAYETYRLLFPTLQGGNSQLMQIAEVEFLGRTGISKPDIRTLIQTDLDGTMFGKHTSIYLRLPFAVGPETDLQGLSMPIRYNDGFIAYLNGVEVARGNAPSNPEFDSVATKGLGTEFVVAEEQVDLRGFAHLLNTGSNVLAIHALNENRSSPDFLLDVQLVNTTTTLNLSQSGYFEHPSPRETNPEEQFIGQLMAPVISPESGFREGALEVSIQSNMTDARIYYSLDGSEPDEQTGMEYSSPIRVSKTTVLRAVATLEGWKNSAVSTRSYLFTADIAGQQDMSGLDTTFPDRWGSQPADYGLDPRVVNPDGRDSYGGRYTRTIQDDLKSIPSISLVLDSDDLFGPKGIYANPTARGDAWDNWERPVSVELIYPDERDGFQENAGIKIQGGAFRRFDLSMKKSLRLVFREQYGVTKLNFPLFGPDATDAFDTVVLRANGNDAWKYAGSHALYIRDAFAMETARAMGMVSSHTTFVHLYLNGAYWGLYNLAERPDASFSSSYHGGDKDDWDALNQDSVPDGTREAWDRMLAMLNEGIDQNAVYQKIQGKNPDGIRDPAIENLLDIENLIDYCLLNFYIGNQDWPGRNYWVGRDRKGGEGFQFYPWDSETAMGLGSGLNANQTGVNTAVARPYGALRANADFRRWFGDRAQRHFSTGGALYVNPAKPQWSRAEPENNRPAARFAQLADFIDSAIVGETARWGDQLNSSPFTRDEHWRREKDELLTNYFPRRSAIVIEQLRRAGLYPQINAPVFNLQEGRLDLGTSLTMSADHGTIYYTLDGSDPRTDITVSTVKPSTMVDASTQRRVLIPSPENGGNALGTGWRQERDFPDATWTSGTGAVGYDTGNGYQDLINMDVQTAMAGQNGSVFIRIPFDAAPDAIADLNFMILRMRYDDGFAAFLNGVQIASANTPGDLPWNATATGANDDAAAVFWQEFEASAYLEHLRPGINLLAIQGLNVSLDSSDFLIDVELMVGKRNITGKLPTSNRYDSPIPLQDLTTVKASALSGSEWSALTEATYIVGEPRLQVSELHYHPADSTPEELATGFDDADAFEFIELYNPGTATFLLDGVRFVDGVTFDFTHSMITRLAPGATVLVVKNLAAFEMRYGPGLPVAGEFTGNFSNSGESVTIVDAEDRTLIAFSYDDDAPELKNADGSGPSLIAVDTGNGPAQEFYWKTSTQTGGSPGKRTEGQTNSVLKLNMMMEGEKVFIECLVPDKEDYGLYSTQDLGNPLWNLVLTKNTVEPNGKLAFEIPVLKEIPTRFFQIRKLSDVP
ncbi:MAG: CotH kinase family protein [Verrucomicrobiota bacterium]